MTLDRSEGSNTQSSCASVDCWPSRSVRLVNLGDFVVIISAVSLSVYQILSMMWVNGRILLWDSGDRLAVISDRCLGCLRRLPRITRISRMDDETMERLNTEYVKGYGALLGCVFYKVFADVVGGLWYCLFMKILVALLMCSLAFGLPVLAKDDVKGHLIPVESESEWDYRGEISPFLMGSIRAKKLAACKTYEELRDVLKTVISELDASYF